jgi:hypothetical protein
MTRRDSAAMGTQVSAAFADARLVRIGGRVYPYVDASTVSRSFLAAIRILDRGVSEMPPCEILDGAGRPIGHVSYNGRVWARTGREREVLVYDPR